MQIDSNQLNTILKEVFGYNRFRGDQENIILSLLSQNDTFVIMPTGAGKSLCYQLPAIVNSGVSIVISPLIALMKNQVDQMNVVGVEARFLNSTLSRPEMTRVKRDTLNDRVKLLYVAPESLTKEENIAFLKSARINFVAIDEAHCISEWGHDFRPEYRKIKSIMREIGDMPVIALTATATPKVQSDIQKNLNMEDAKVFKSSFNRPNLYYEVRPKREAKKQLIKYVKSHVGKSGIVYCLSRKKVEEIADFLKLNGISAAPYHGGMDSVQRVKNQDAFLSEEVDVIVATIAFGMGIDKPDVRFVIHYDAPKSIEGYYQETGRAGRDGLEGECLMFYSYNDILRLEKFTRDKTVTERENASFLLREMASYAESSVCRRRQLLHYFGEEFEHNGCHMCDNCLHPRPQFEATQQVKQAILAIQSTGERFQIDHIVNVLIGEESDYVKSYSHNQLEMFGVGKNHDEAYWRSVIRQTLFNELLTKDIENPGVFKVNERGRAFLDDPYKIVISQDHDYPTEGEEESERSHVGTKSYDTQLFEILKSLRRIIAKQKDLPPYVIFQDPSLEEMAILYPTTYDELLKIVGVGESKAKKFGRPFLEAIADYVEENEIVTPGEILIKTSGLKSKSKIEIITQIDRQRDLEDIAQSKRMRYEDLIREIESICNAGTKLNLDYYIDQLLDDDRQDDIYDYFLNAETDHVEEAVKELSEEYSEDEVRLMRIKFMSEYAH